ncbi:MAG: hydroxyacid dehydrogenase [Clostridia bacterium]|nr:hydroxyacid dehydrogenase [Clostridia bacterium]
MKIVILDAATIGDDISLAPLAALGELTVYQSTKPEELAARLADCDVVVQNKVRIDRTAFAAAKHLKVVAELATGYDNIDLEAAREHGVAVCNVPGYSTPSVVQLTMAMVLSLATHLPAYREHVASGRYSAEGVANKLTPVYHELAGKTWGVVGYGDIGRGVGEVAKALGCRLLVCRKTPSAEEYCVDIDTLCREADIISIHTPLSDSTRGLINRERLAIMKKDVLLINVARGAVTDEAAVAEALQSGRLGGLGVDVYSTEPFSTDHPFYAIKDDPRVCFTPHMAWGSFEARTRCLATVADNIRAFFAGERQNRVD